MGLSLVRLISPRGSYDVRDFHGMTDLDQVSAVPSKGTTPCVGMLIVRIQVEYGFVSFDKSFAIRPLPYIMLF